MRALIRVVLFIAFSVGAVAVASGPVLAQEAVQISGTVTVNDGLAPANLTITVVSSEGDDCGTTVTGDGGSLSLDLAVECQPGETVQFFLGDRDTGLLSTTQVALAAGAQQVEVAFTTGAAPQQEDQVAAIESQRAEPLLEATQLFVLVLAVIIGTVLLLYIMVTSFRALAKEEREGNYRRQVEGLVILMVVVALIILGVTGKISEQGLTPVLAAIIGYAIGQARSTGAAAGTPLPPSTSEGAPLLPSTSGTLEKGDSAPEPGAIESADAVEAASQSTVGGAA